MYQDVYRFYAKKSLLICSFNFNKATGIITTAKAFDPNRYMGNGIQKNQKIYDYNNKKVISINAHEAITILNSINGLLKDPNFTTKQIIHDKSKSSGSVSQAITTLSISLYNNNINLMITDKENGQNSNTGYYFYNPLDLEIFKNYLKYISISLAPISAQLKAMNDLLHPKTNKYNKNQQQNGQNYDNTQYNNFDQRKY